MLATTRNSTRMNAISDWLEHTLRPKLGADPDTVSNFRGHIELKLKHAGDDTALLWLENVPKTVLSDADLVAFFDPFIREGFSTTRYRLRETQKTPASNAYVRLHALGFDTTVTTCGTVGEPPEYMLEQIINKETYMLVFKTIDTRFRPLLQFLLDRFGSTSPHHAGGTRAMLHDAFWAVRLSCTSPIPMQGDIPIWLGRPQREDCNDATLFETIMPIMLPGAVSVPNDPVAFAALQKTDHKHRIAQFVRRWALPDGRHIWLLFTPRRDKLFDFTIASTHPSRYDAMLALYNRWELQVDETKCQKQHKAILKEATPPNLHKAELWATYMSRAIENEANLPEAGLFSKRTLPLCLATFSKKIAKAGTVAMRDKQCDRTIRRFATDLIKQLFPFCTITLSRTDYDEEADLGHITIECHRSDADSIIVVFVAGDRDVDLRIGY